MYKKGKLIQLCLCYTASIYYTILPFPAGNSYETALGPKQFTVKVHFTVLPILGCITLQDFSGLINYSVMVTARAVEWAGTIEHLREGISGRRQQIQRIHRFHSANICSTLKAEPSYVDLIDVHNKKIYYCTALLK